MAAENFIGDIKKMQGESAMMAPKDTSLSPNVGLTSNKLAEHLKTISGAGGSLLPRAVSAESEFFSADEGSYIGGERSSTSIGNEINPGSTIPHLSSSEAFSTPPHSSEDVTIGFRSITPTPPLPKKMPPSPLQGGSSHLQEQPAGDNNIEVDHGEFLEKFSDKLCISAVNQSTPVGLKRSHDGISSSRPNPAPTKVTEPVAFQAAAPSILCSGTTCEKQSTPVGLNQSSDGTSSSQPNPAYTKVTEPVAFQAAAPSSALPNSNQPTLNNLSIDIDQAAKKISWAGIVRSTIAWTNYILTGFDTRDDSVENHVHRLQEQLIAHEIEQLLPQKETGIENKLKLQPYVNNPKEQRNFLLYKILKKENALYVRKLQEQEKQRALDEATSEKHNYEIAKAQLVNELNILYAQIQLEEKPEATRLNKIDSYGITHGQIDDLYKNLLLEGKLQPASPLLRAIETAKEKYEKRKKEYINKLNKIHESQLLKIGNAKNTSQQLDELYEKQLNPLDPVAASNYQEEIDTLLDSLDDEYETTRKSIIHKHFIENKEADIEKEQIVAVNKADKENRDKALKLFEEKLELNKARHNEELKLLDEELARKKARYIELLRLLEMDVEALKKNYAKYIANEEKEAIKIKLRADLLLEQLSLAEQELKLKNELDKRNANPSFTKKNVLWGITQATTTVVAASSGTVTAVACSAITIFTFHISLPLLLLIGWAGYRINFSVYQDSIKNTLNSFFVNGLFHDPKYPNDLTKKVGPLKKAFMILATAVAGGAGVSIAAITFTSVSSCVVHLLLFIGLASVAAMPPVIIPIAGVVAAISLIAITALMFNTISNIIKNDNNSINRFCRKLYRKGFEKCCSEAVANVKFFFQHLTAKDVLHGVVTSLFVVAGIAIATLATIALISSWHSSLVGFLETTAGIRDIVTNGVANGIALVACYCLTPVARFPVVLEKAAITFGLIAHAICHPSETYNNCAKKLSAFKEQAKAECVDAPSTALFIGKTVLVSACYIVAVTTIVGFIALNAIGNGALADEGGNILTSICGWFAVTLPKLGQNITSFASATAVSAAFAIVATQDTYGRPVESHDIEIKKLSSNNAAAEGNGALKIGNNNSRILDENEVGEKENIDLQRASQNTEAAAPLLLKDKATKAENRTCSIAEMLPKFSGIWRKSSDHDPIPKNPPSDGTSNTNANYSPQV